MKYVDVSSVLNFACAMQNTNFREFICQSISSR